MSATEEILSGIDPRQLAAALGTDEATAMSAAAAAIPTLIGSLQANAASTEGSEGLFTALGQHADTGLFGESVDLDAVDTADGQKILAHALADDPQRLQAVSGLGGTLLAKLLPLLAPIVMSYLAGKLGMGGSTSRTSQAGSGDLLGDLLGGLLGGAGGSAGGGGLGDILGQILGGGQSDTAATGGQAGYAPTPGSGTVFNPPDGPGELQIPEEDTGEAYGQEGRQQQPGSGDILGGLLGQILGR
ncbi:MAG TPA: DUF937 domain-containing protein [Propionicimonas sp.]|nr:DUF937 domain-containing protein [Propionicimonas sp.]